MIRQGIGLFAALMLTASPALAGEIWVSNEKDNTVSVIDTETYEGLKRALLQFKNQLENHNVHNYRAIATSAMREAKNGKDVVKKLYEATGLQVEIISGQEEANLVQLAISQKVSMEKGGFLLIDIGGGSIELVAVVDGQIIKKQSFVLGMVRVLELHKKKEKD